MNERIKEIALQAKITFTNYGSGDFLDEDDICRRRLEKFAELIAKECAQLAMTQHNSTSPDDYDEMDPYDKGCDDTASRISGLIRRVFGVE